MNDLQQVMHENPDLCEWGLAYEHCRRFNRVAHRNPIDPEHFRLCVEWLKLCNKRKTVNELIGSSYGLKHLVEAWSGRYVTNGSFIAAVIAMDIPYHRYWDSPNVHVAISSKDLPGSDSTRFGGTGQ